MQPKAAQVVHAVGGDLSAARQEAEAHLAQIDEQLEGLERIPTETPSSHNEALADAQQKRAELETRIANDERALESATVALSEADQVVAALRTEIASKQGELKAIDRAALETKRQAALDDPVFQVPDDEDIPLQRAVDVLEAVKRKLEECDGRLNAAKGQLHLVAGHVGAERLAQQEEAVKYARDEVVDRERTEMAALRLLTEIESVEAARTSHLGRTLAAPISETFRALTGGRYGQLGLDPDLKTRDIAAVGAARDVSDLSVGTREQLATLIRLAIAGHLQTALILDDQLVHSDPERLNWFRERLNASARERAHQVIVFTCRPDDYLPAGGEPNVTVVDLRPQLSR
jgi:DNA repair exonuclease SbcCD ATPase subunit